VNPAARKGLESLAALRGNWLEALKGNWQAQYSRINNQWRICFEWPDSASSR
jgi:toxin HigB-1